MSGINRALETRTFDSVVALEAYTSKMKKPCIFLSHISIDKNIVRNIGKYLMEQADVDIYLDENDDELQAAAIEGDPYKVTEFIEKGLSMSTHLMCLVSEKTSSSWWVPYEIGFAKKSGKNIASLKLKGDIYLPDFLKVGTVLKGTKSLNDYLQNIANTMLFEERNIMDSCLFPNTESPHPLDDYLDWKE